MLHHLPAHVGGSLGVQSGEWDEGQKVGHQVDLHHLHVRKVLALWTWTLKILKSNMFLTQVPSQIDLGPIFFET